MSFEQTAFLYVEDDPASRQVMQMIMEKVMGVENLVNFEDSTDFISRILALPVRPDFILLDIHIQPHNGFDMLRLLRQDAAFDGVKIVALTASVMNEEVEQIRQNGFDGAIAKPVNITAFPQLIERIIRGESVWFIG
jgi:CheY-like chemotaxis protein